MFNFGKRVQERQLKRAVLIQNAIMVGVFTYQRKAAGAGGIKDSQFDKFSAVIAAAINQLFGKEAAQTFSADEKSLLLKMIESIKSDDQLEKLILRVLFDCVSSKQLGQLRA